jgi:3-phenylpropionate/trans-cinnamate dioxygenase ferredoxin reductase component
MTERIVVVGAGLVGARIVESVRAQGYQGSLTLVGDEAHCPYDRPPLSKQMLAGADPGAGVFLLTAGRLDELGVDWRAGVAAAGLDTARREVRLSDGSLLPFGRLAIATGAAPILLPGTDGMAGVHVLRTLDDCLGLRQGLASARSVVVLGGGVLGCEIAATLTGTGADVTLVEAAHSLLARAVPDGALSGFVRRMHEAAGVQVLVDRRVDRLAGDGHVSQAVLDDGSSIAADMVVLAIGVRPSTKWLAGSGLDIADGVLCDQYLQTAVPGVFAAGDVARQRSAVTGVPARHEHWTGAASQALVAAHNLLAAGDADLKASQSVPYVWSDQYGRRLQIAGDTGAVSRSTTEHVVVRDDAAHRMLTLYARDDETVTGGAAIGAPKALANLRRLLASPPRLEDALEAFAAA